MKIFTWVENFLRELDGYRDKILIAFIKPFWPRFITPNHLTWLRVFISIALFILLFFYGVTDKVLILSLFCVGILSDLFDGSVARGLNKVTEFGAMLDPTADRLLILPIAVYSLYTNEKWLLLVLLLMEILNAVTSIFYKSKEIYFESNIFGKSKMVIQSVVFVAILFVFPNAPNEIFIDILWISAIFTILSIFSRVLELNQKGHIKNKALFKEHKHENI
jgi:CDP-diacylglycerol--glycerol-3-phosphate 3-phosphatidyltransferase